MSNLAVRDDLFGFVRAFLTPRQGVDDNTNPKPPEQEGEATNGPPQGDQANQPAPGANPISTVPPVPTGTRELPPQGYTGAPVYVPPGLSKEDEQMLAQSQSYRILQAQQAEAQRNALEAYRWQSFASGLGGIAGGLTGGNWAGSPVAAPGHDFASGSPMLSLEQIKGFEKDAASAMQAARDKAAAIALAKEQGWSDAQINAMIAAGDYGKLREAAFNTADKKARGEGDLKQYEVNKAREFDAHMANPEFMGRLMAQTGINDPAVLRTLYLTGKIDEVVQKAAEGGPDFAEYNRAYPGGVDPRTGKPFSYADYLDTKQKRASPVGDAFEKEVGKEFGTQLTRRTEAGRLANENIHNSLRSYELLRTNKALVGGVLGRSEVQDALRFIQGLNIPGLDMKGLDVNAELKQGTTSILLRHARSLGVNPTDRDAKIIEDYANGNHTNSREAMLAMQRTIVRGELAAQLNANAAIDRALASGTTPEMARYLEGQRITNLPDVTGVIFHGQHLQNIEQAIASNVPPQEMRESIDKQYGPGMYDYYIQVKHPELAARR